MYTKNEVDHGTFWKLLIKRELSFRINLWQRVIFFRNAPLCIINITLKLFS